MKNFIWSLLVVSTVACGQGFFAGFGSGTGARSGWPVPDFEAITETGFGLPSECGTETVISVQGTSFSCTRSNSAYCPKQDGTYVLLAADQCRWIRALPTDPTVSVVQEPARSNGFGNTASNLASASWTKTNMTCTRTVTGPNGVANGASRCCATASNATVTQLVASGTGATSMSVKRSVGTGAVYVTRDGFTTSTNIGPALLTTKYQRVVPRFNHNCPGGCIIATNLASYSASSTAVGVKLATTGDCVDLWAMQDENLSGSDLTAGPVPSMLPMDEFTGSNAEEKLYFTAPSFAVASMSIEQLFAGASSNVNYIMAATDLTNSLVIANANGSTTDQRFTCSRNFGSSVSAGGGVPISMSAASWGLVSCSSVSAGSLQNFSRTFPDAAGTGAAANITPTRFQIGGYWAANGFSVGSAYRNLCASSSTSPPCPVTVGNFGNRPIAWVGDSITYGNAGSPGTAVRPPLWLENLLRVDGATTERSVANLGVGGYRTDQCLTTWRSNVRGRGYTTLVLMCGVNSAIQVSPATAAAAWLDLKAILDEAKSDNMRVIPMTILPYGSSNSWSSAGQTYITYLNTQLQAWCTTNGVTCIDSYTDFSAGGASPQNMKSAYDSGDGLHPNVTGSKRLAALVAAASP